MTVEFVESGDPAALPAAPAETIGGEALLRRRLAVEPEVLAALGTLLLAAVLCLVAPFQTVYTDAQRGDGGVTGSAVDGWGRYHLLGDSTGLPGAHEPRYGIPMVFCAAGFAVVAAAVGVSALRRHAHRASRPAVLGVLALVGVLAGVTAAMWLQTLAVFDTVHAYTRGADTLPEPVSGVRLGYGAAPWLASAGVVAGLLALLACARLRETRQDW